MHACLHSHCGNLDIVRLKCISTGATLVACVGPLVLQFGALKKKQLVCIIIRR